MKYKMFFTGTMLLSSVCYALPDGWVSSKPQSDDVTFYVNSSKVITLTPIDNNELSLDQIGHEMHNLYDNFGFHCDDLSKNTDEIGFKCKKVGQTNPEMPKEIAIYFLSIDHKPMVASLIGGASYDDLKQIIEFN